MAYTETTDPSEVATTVDIKYFDYGMGFTHNMPCCVYPDNQPAVLNCNTGVFEPSWAAQNNGWRLVQFKDRPNRFALVIFRLIEKHIFKRGLRTRYGFRNF